MGDSFPAGSWTCHIFWSKLFFLHVVITYSCKFVEFGQTRGSISDRVADVGNRVDSNRKALDILIFIIVIIVF